MLTCFDKLNDWTNILTKLFQTWKVEQQEKINKKKTWRKINILT